MTQQNLKPGAVPTARGLPQKLNSSLPDNSPPNRAQGDPVLELLFDRCCVLADRVAAGQLPFLDGVDFAWSAAELAGTVDRLGPDAVQGVLAQAFMGVRR
jgi:hypothetical protein